MAEKFMYIPARLKNSNAEGYVAGTEQIIDDASGKTQAQIDAEVNVAISSLQGQIDNIRLADAYTKAESDAKYAAKNDVNVVSGDVSTLTEAFNTLSVNVGTISGNVDTLSGNVDTISSNVNTLSNGMSSLSGDVSTLSGTVGTLVSDVDSLSTTVGQLTPSSENRPTINKTWAEMIQLKNSNGFIPGQTYRITDYLTAGNTTTEYGGLYGYAGHPFDVIVTALTENTLDEDARAAKHEGDSYFANCNLHAWRLKYILDPVNDPRLPHRLINAQTKGWIYFMEDEHFNSANYDFKNILTQGVKVTDFKYKDFVITEVPVGEVYIKYIMTGTADGNAWEDVLQGVYTVDSNDTKLFYLFSYLNEDGTVIDASVKGVQNTYPVYNKMSETYPGEKPDESVSALLSPQLNLFICDWEYTASSGNLRGVALPSHNVFGQRAHSNTFGNLCVANDFSNWTNCNVFGNLFRGNKLNFNVHGCIFGNNAKSNIVTATMDSLFVGNNFQENSVYKISNCHIGNEFFLNEVHDMAGTTIGESCVQNVFPAVVADCVIGNNFKNNEGSGWLSYSTIGDGCQYCDFDASSHLTLGDSCISNIFHSRCSYITMGNRCQNNVFEGGNNYITMGERCIANHFNKISSYIIFGSSEEDIKGFYCGIAVDSYNDHIILNATSTLSTSNRFMGIKISTRLYSPLANNSSASSYTYKVINNSETEQQYTTTYTNSESKVINA